MRPRRLVLTEPGVRSEVRLALRFAVVGLVGVGVNSVVLWLLTERGAVYYLISSVVATEIAIVSNFFLNHTWTFAGAKDDRPIHGRLLTFNVFSLGGLILTVTALFLLKQFVGIPYLMANLVAITAGAAWNYVASRRWTWRSAPVGQA